MAWVSVAQCSVAAGSCPVLVQQEGRAREVGGRVHDQVY